MILLLFCTLAYSLGEKLDIYSCAGARLYSASEKLLEFWGPEEKALQRVQNG